MAPGLQTPTPATAAAATTQHQPRSIGQLASRQGQGRLTRGPLLGGRQELPAAARLEGIEGHASGELEGDVAQRELKASVARMALVSDGTRFEHS